MRSFLGGRHLEGPQRMAPILPHSLFPCNTQKWTFLLLFFISCRVVRRLNQCSTSMFWVQKHIMFFFYITGRRAPEPFLGPMFGLVQSCWDLWDTAHDKGALAASDPGGTTYCSSIIFFVSLPDAHRRRWDCTRVGCVLVLGAGCIPIPPWPGPTSALPLALALARTHWVRD